VGLLTSVWDGAAVCGFRGARDAASLHRGRRGARLRGKEAGKKICTLYLSKTIGT
jgi:hypothetical protein